MKVTFNKEYYTTNINIDSHNNKRLEIKKITLNIFQRALRFLFGAYSQTIWTAKKSENLRTDFAKKWKEIEAEVKEATIFKKIFKIEKRVEELPDDLSETIDKDPDAYTFSMHSDLRTFDLNDPCMILGQLPDLERRSFEREVKRLYKNLGIEGVIKLPELSVKKERIETPVTLEEQIDSFVANFLHPYITGRIRPEGERIDPKLAVLHGVRNEEKNRDSLMVLLHREFARENKTQIEEIALNSYLKIAAQGLYVNQGLQGIVERDFTKDSAEFEELILAISSAIKKDFPTHQIEQEDLRNRIESALKDVNESRKDYIPKILRQDRD